MSLHSLQKAAACGFLLALVSNAEPLRAATAVSLKDAMETSGKFALSASALQVDTGATSVELPFDSILEADFSDQPFHIDYFSSALSPNQLPASWKAQDIGKHPADKNGSFTYTNGILTLNGTGYDRQRGEKEDQMFIAGQIWTGGGGQLTGRLKNVTGDLAGPMVRGNTDSLSAMLFMGMKSGDGGGLFVGRGNQGDHVGWAPFSAGFPTWFRLSWNGYSLDSEVSTDGRQWATIGQNGSNNASNIWVGFGVNSGQENVLGTAVIDQILLSPSAAEPGTLPNGVLFTDGTFLFGGPDFINPNGGQMSHAGKGFPLAPNQVAAVISHPTTLQQRTANLNSLPGLLFKNGDFMQGDIDNIQGSGFFQITSIVLGPAVYYGDTARAYLFRPVKPVPSKYEVRLHDGSIIQVKNIAIDGSQLIIDDVSGIPIHVDPFEIAQFRAGSAVVQNLIDLPWKTVSESSAPTAKPAKLSPAAEAPKTNAAPATPASLFPPDANSFSAPPIPPAETWEGPNQEQIIVITAGNEVEFPLSGKFTSLVARLALSPDSPVGAQTGFRILADGKEVGSTLPLKAGDAPIRLNVRLSHPQKLTCIVTSTTPGARLLLIDPVALREL